MKNILCESIEHTLWAFENRALRKMFEHERGSTGRMETAA
jgi:hypothetical protein